LETLLMATAGRTEALDELDGPGAAILADRIQNPSKVLQDLNDYAAIVNPMENCSTQLIRSFARRRKCSALSG
jgi:hypothetical protein